MTEPPHRGHAPADAATAALVRSCIQRIATGPELSRDLSFEEARDTMRAILDARVDPVQAGVFLIALRMKRETDDENRGVLQAILDTTRHVAAAVDELLVVSDPHDGFSRTVPVSAFLPAVLAACGLPAVSHGVPAMGPKYGVTTEQVLARAGLAVDATPQDAAARLDDPRCGWAYVSQSQYCPPLFALAGLRDRIVKRPCLSTVESTVAPVRGGRATYLLIGYVHKNYPPVYASLARHAGFAATLIVKGVEGGVIPSLLQPAAGLRVAGETERSWRLAPRDAGITTDERALPRPDDADDAGALARHAAARGLKALDGVAGTARDALVYGAAIALAHTGRAGTVAEGAALARVAIDSGEARRRLGA